MTKPSKAPWRAPETHGATPQATVLVVDDEERNRSLLRANLEPAYRVLEATDGDAALEVIAQEPVDLVLLDVMMPGRSGFDVCATIKAERRSVLLPVVLLTALHDQESRNTGLTLGADDYLTKPVDRRELLLRVRGLLRIRQQEQQILDQLETLGRMQRLKDDLVSLIVHDLRNPLTSLTIILELLREQQAEGKASGEDVLEMAVDSAKRLGELIDDVLEVKLLEADAAVVQRVRQPLLDPVQRAVTALDGAARERGVRLVLDRTQEPVEAVDARLLCRAIENLVGNALRYAPRDSAVEIGLRDEAGRWVVEVADRGPGVPDAIKAKLFDKYATGEVNLSQRRGFGLGLYLVQLVAQGHGGSATVHDRPGGGALFRLSLARGERLGSPGPDERGGAA